MEKSAQLNKNQLILNLAIPNIISNITIPLLGMADVAIAGHIGGDSAIGAISIGSTLFNFIYWNCAFLRMGCSGLTAQAYGANDWKESTNLLIRSLILSLTIAITLLLLKNPISHFAIDYIECSESIRPLVKDYLLTRFWAIPASISIFSIHGWFIGMQDSRSPMWIAIFSNIVNIIFSIYFAIHLELGIKGVAWGTVTAQYASLALSLLIFYAKYRKKCEHTTLKDSLSKSKILRFFDVNIDIFIRTLIITIAYTLFTINSSKFGETILATNTLLMQLYTLFSYMSDGFAFAAESLSGRYVGEKRYDYLQSIIKQLLVWAGGVATLFILCYIISWEPILRLFNPSIKVLECAHQYIFWVISIPLAGFLPFMIDGIMLGATKTKVLRNSVAISFIVYLILLYTLMPIIGNNAIWAAFLTFILLRGILLIKPLMKLTKADINNCNT